MTLYRVSRAVKDNCPKIADTSTSMPITVTAFELRDSLRAIINMTITGTVAIQVLRLSMNMVESMLPFRTTVSVKYQSTMLTIKAVNSHTKLKTLPETN